MCVLYICDITSQTGQKVKSQEVAKMLSKAFQHKQHLLTILCVVSMNSLECVCVCSIREINNVQYSIHEKQKVANKPNIDVRKYRIFIIVEENSVISVQFSLPMCVVVFWLTVSEQISALVTVLFFGHSSIYSKVSSVYINYHRFGLLSSHGY